MSSACWRTLAMGIMTSFIIFDNILSSPCPEKLVEKNNDTICTTDECIQMARTIHQNMRSDIDPCDDFYKFACGGKTKEKDLGIIHELKRITHDQLKSIVIEGYNSDFPPLRMAYDYYQSCTADETAKKDGVRPIYKKVGKWPLTEDDKSISWLEVMRTSRNLGFSPNYIFSTFITENRYNKSENVIVIMLPTLPIVTAKLQQGLRNSSTKTYFDHMMLTGVKFEALTSNDNLKSITTNTQSEIEKVFNFEVELAKITPLISPSVHSAEIGTLKQVKEQYPLIKWTPVLEALIGIGVKLNDTEKTIVLAPKFIVELELLLEATPERVIVNYFIWRNIFSSLKLTFAIEKEPRSEACITRTQESNSKNTYVFLKASGTASEKVDSTLLWDDGEKDDKLKAFISFSDVIDAQYVRKYFNNDSRKSVRELMHQIHGEVEKSLLHSSWIDNKTKEYAMEKLDAITSFIGYADSLLHQDTEMKRVYGSVHIDMNDHYETSLNLLKLINDRTFSILRQVSQKYRLSRHISPITINTFYVPAENTMIIPAGILQNLYYSVNRPNYLNFGIIGYLIGHELLHSFDNTGCLYDKYGQMKDWWQPETKAKYKDRTKCFVDQYGSYYFEEIEEYANGNLTLGENMADNEGIKNTYRAYKLWQSTHEKEKKLPGLDYTPEQMFWISSANLWCKKYPSSTLKLLLQMDKHSPSVIRVNKVLSNQKEFAKDFSCPNNSKMNPSKKCQFL